MDFVRSYFGTNWSGKKVRTKVFNWSEVHLYQSNFLQNPYFRHLYLWKSRCVADILRQIVLNFSPKEYESEILQVQIIHDGFEDSLQQLSPANDIVMNRDYLEQGDLLRGIVNWLRLNTAVQVCSKDLDNTQFMFFVDPSLKSLWAPFCSLHSRSYIF